MRNRRIIGPRSLKLPFLESGDTLITKIDCLDSFCGFLTAKGEIQFSQFYLKDGKPESFGVELLMSKRLPKIENFEITELKILKDYVIFKGNNFVEPQSELFVVNRGELGSVFWSFQMDKIESRNSIFQTEEKDLLLMSKIQGKFGEIWRQGLIQLEITKQQSYKVESYLGRKIRFNGNFNPLDLELKKIVNLETSIYTPLVIIILASIFCLLCVLLCLMFINRRFKLKEEMKIREINYDSIEVSDAEEMIEEPHSPSLRREFN
jgi:uncharacterized membrane protein YsdA (DUF1294 family)